ncbi:MAG: hypothetical protein HDS71_02115 [Bacteroidales bacterium]|nr:hypothetical protein [Bacteroidales bacterium]
MSRSDYLFCSDRELAAVFNVYARSQIFGVDFAARQVEDFICKSARPVASTF